MAVCRETNVLARFDSFEFCNRNSPIAPPFQLKGGHCLRSNVASQSK